MRSSALVFVAMLSIAAAPGAAHGGGRVATKTGEEAAGSISPARQARLRGRQVRKARLELTRAVELEKGALSGRSKKPATDLFRAEALRSRARARLALMNALYESGLHRTAREHLSSARRYESQARAIENDPGAQALFRQTLLDARSEHDYWQRMGSYGSGRRPVRKTVSRSRPSPKVRQVEYLNAAEAARSGRERARNRTAVRVASEPAARPNMIRSRPLRFYWDAFGAVYQRMLGEMSESDLWIDVGAGQGQALAGYANMRPEGARVMAIDLVDDARRQASRFPAGRFQVRKGDVRRVRVGRKAQLVTDVFAAVSYGDAPDRVIARYGALLAPGGRAMLFVEEQRNTVLSRDGTTSEDLVGYLGRVKGFEVEDVRVFDAGSAVILRRTEAAVRAPRLELLEFKDGGPPTRVFRMLERGDLSGPLRSRFAPRQRR